MEIQKIASALNIAVYLLSFFVDRDTLSRKRHRDLKRLTRCHTASENFDAEVLLNIRVFI